MPAESLRMSFPVHTLNDATLGIGIPPFAFGPYFEYNVLPLWATVHLPGATSLPVARGVFTGCGWTCILNQTAFRKGEYAMLETIRFNNLDCVHLENASLSLLVTQSTGPRLLSLRLHGGQNLLAELPDTSLDCPGAGTLRLWGGHRLWHAPEVSRRTYLPDDEPVEISPVPNGFLVTQPVETATGLQKSMRIVLLDKTATVVIDHSLTNHGLWPVECAPWAITQMRRGGVALLPQRTSFSDPEGLQPNRAIVLWPYTDAASPMITWGNRFIFIQATMQSGALKVGFPNSQGWLGYLLDETLFVKRAAFDSSAAYYDLGSSSQCYCNPHFLELETLGPRSTIEPGASVTHREVWEIHHGVGMELTEESAHSEAEKLGLSEASAHLNSP
jgi:hypothetical protein